MGNRRLILDIEEIVRLYTQEHKSTLQISKEMECSVMAIFRRLKAAGIETKSQSEVMKGRKLPDWHRQKIKEGAEKRDQTGEKNPHWRGGRSYTKSKNAIYPIIRVNGRYVKEHRYVVEQHLRRKLLRTEEVHHKDENKFNNDISNLVILSKSEHAKLHNADRYYKQRKSDTMKQRRAENPNWGTREKKGT